MAEKDLKQTKPTTGAKASVSVSKPTGARAIKPAMSASKVNAQKPVKNTNSSRISLDINTQHLAQNKTPQRTVHNAKPQANNSNFFELPGQKSDSTLSTMQAPIMPKSSLSETSAPLNKAQKKEQKKIEQRLKSSSIDLDDLEQLNEHNLRQYRSRVKRNRAIITTLIILLLIAIAGCVAIIVVRRMANNCTVKVHGDVDAEFIVDGQRVKRFRTPIGVQGNRVYMIDTDIDIQSSGNYNVYFTIEVFQSGEKINNTFAYSYNHDLFHQDGNGKYSSNSPISGNQTINLFDGVVLDYDYEKTLTTDNFSMKINIYFERA